MKETIKVFVFVSVGLFLALLASAFLSYEANAAMVVLLVLWTLTSLLALIGFVPVLGQIVYWYIADQALFPAFFAVFPGIEPTWLTDCIFWLGFIYTLGFTNFTLWYLQKE